MHESLFLTASFLDIRTKNFGRVPGTTRKECAQTAHTQIKKMFELAPDSVKSVVNKSKSTQSNTQLENKTEIDNMERLQFFDIANGSKKNIEKLVGIYREIALYSVEPPKNISPIEYWNQNSEVDPGLFFCFDRVLCMQGSSVRSEQLFTHIGYTVLERRNRLAPERVNKIMVIYEYY